MSIDNEVATASKQTQEALEEMKEMGIIDDTQPEETPEPQETKEEVQEEPKEVKEEVEESEENNRPQDRTPQYVPVNKYNELRHSLKDLKAELEGYKTKVETKTEVTPDFDDTATKLAEKHGLEADFIKDLMSSVKQSVSPTLPDDIKSKLDLLDQQAKSQAQLKEFENDYQKISEEFNDLSEKDKREIQRLAFTRGYETTPIRTIAIQYLHDNPSRATVEGETRGKSAKHIVDLDNMTEEDLQKISPDSPEFEQFLKRLDSKSNWHRS